MEPTPLSLRPRFFGELLRPRISRASNERVDTRDTGKTGEEAGQLALFFCISFGGDLRAGGTESIADCRNWQILRFVCGIECHAQAAAAPLQLDLRAAVRKGG